MKLTQAIVRELLRQSALPPKADLTRTSRHVRFVPPLNEPALREARCARSGASGTDGVTK